MATAPEPETAAQPDTASPSAEPLRIAFIHPDLGIGGAERLIIDAALALQERGHHPTIYTPFQDAARTFAQVAPPSPRVPVTVVASPFPRTLVGRLHALLAALRCAFVALYVCLFCAFDVAVVDLVAAPLFVLALFRKPALFYCHYPDKLLAASLAPPPGAAAGTPASARPAPPPPSPSPSPLRRVAAAYRGIIDFVDARAVALAAKTAVNSLYTARAFSTVYPTLAPPTVIHPCVPTAPAGTTPASAHGPAPRAPYLLSLNRYEAKKCVELAVDALRSRALAGSRAQLVIAGGFDPRLRDNVSTLAKLRAVVSARGLEQRVTLLQNVTDAHRGALLRDARAVLYTPRDEHFGIVPLEAMAAGVPVVAVRAAGPVESVVDGHTGFLVDAEPDAFAAAAAKLLADADAARVMGCNGRRRVQEFFSPEVMGRSFEDVLLAAVGAAE